MLVVNTLATFIHNGSGSDGLPAIRYLDSCDLALLAWKSAQDDFGYVYVVPTRKQRSSYLENEGHAAMFFILSSSADDLHIRKRELIKTQANGIGTHFTTGTSR
jgi:hypothetical protein